MLWISTLLILIIPVSTSKTYNFVCKSGWGDRHNDYCYKKFLNISTNWHDARDACHSQGGFLVGIRDQQKQNHIQGLAGGVSNLWTGGNDIDAESSWHWDGGDSLSTYSNWIPGEPNNSGNKEDCLDLPSQYSRKWNDVECSLRGPYICELHACHLPDHCINTTCTKTDDYQCIQCQDEGSTAEHSLYWPTSDNKTCEATCSWKENWCWPGRCADHLAKNCICSAGFYKSSSTPARCQLSKEAHIVTCRLGAESDKEEVGNSTSHGDCEKVESTYINFQPKSLSYKFVTSFETPKNIPSYPIHIKESHFGVVHAEVRLYKEDLNETKTHLQTESLTNMPNCSTSFGDLDPKAGLPIDCKNVLFHQRTWSMQDGERLCLTYKTQSGGFMKYKDFMNRVSDAETYTRISKEKDVCVKFDSSPPVHCGEISSCPGLEPVMIVQGRLTRNPNITIKVQDWMDPFPMKPDQASGIKSYAISIHKMKEVDNLTLIMDEKGHLYNMSHNEINITLPQQPALYGIALEVLDNAGNVKSARRFVMFDNSSEIKINPLKHLKVTSASRQTNYTWQTHREKSCISWENRYYNSYNSGFNLLRKIQKDYHGVYQGVYEQESGILPINGTTNVYGVTSYFYSWYNGENAMLTDVLVPNFPAQSFCNNYGVRDGETHTVTITSKDIMNNTLSENITFHVDASVPDIEDLWLTKDGERQLFVHNSTDLARLVLEFKAFDSHSGLYSIEYFLGTTLGGNELAYKSLAVQTLENQLNLYFIEVINFSGDSHGFKTPYLEAILDEKCPRSFATCFRFPLDRIHKLSTFEESKLYFHLYVYNLAGHFLEVKTDPFIHRSHFPPSSGTVVEVDLENNPSGDDVDYIFQSDILCFDWNGLWHVDNVSMAIGIGSTMERVDVISFQSITKDTKCLYNLHLTPFKKYYTFARASVRNGIQSVIVSDGFTIIDTEEIVNAIHVHSGIPCWSNEVVITAEKTNTSGTFLVKSSKLKDNQVYTIFPSDISLTSKDVIWLDKQKQQFVAIVQQPMFKTNDKSLLNDISIFPCQEGKKYQADRHVFNVFWTVDGDKIEDITHFKVGLYEVKADGSETIIETFSNVEKHLQIHWNHLNLKSNAAYQAIVKPCFQKTCLAGQKSETVKIEDAFRSGNNVQASIFVPNIHNQNVNINGLFNAFRCGLTENALGYAGSLFNAINPQNQIIPWMFLSSNESTSINVSLKMPVYGYKSMKFCVKGICRSGQSAISCSQLSRASNPNEYEGQILYEIDADTENFDAIIALANSQHIGEKLRLIHDAEVDFTIPGRRVYGVIKGMYGKTVVWFLRKSTYLSQQACTADKYCLQSTTSTNGIGRFNTEHLPADKYFICASFENASELTTHLKNNFLCGNGFIVDDSPPNGGRVEILSDNQEFITNKDGLEIQWSGFYDNAISDEELGIGKYEISIGSSPGAQDVVKSRNVGMQNSVTISNLSLSNGMTYFATVTAFDFAGHNRTVSSPGKTLDLTAPVVGKISVRNPGSQNTILSTVDLFVRWDGFVDKESGIKDIFLGVGSTNESTDISDFHLVEGEFASIKESVSMLDGYQYFIILKIMNHAGLHTIAVSESFMFDRSPPQSGFVYDGLTKDTEYQYETQTYNCFWLGFVDPHTDIEYFEVGLGTKPFLLDVFPSSNVGLRQNFTWSGMFEPGVRYFATVTACNRGGLCTVEASNGVIMDDSPPVPGLVHVGFSGYHEPFLPQNHTLSASWVGFNDRQSGIDHFEWCLGTTPGACQLLAFENIMLSNTVTRTGMDLPISTALYLTLRAFNKIGLSVERTSAKFQIDISPPVLIRKPTFNTNIHKVSLINGTQFDRSLLLVEWQFQDLESSVVKHHVSLEVNRNGHVSFEATELGSQTHLTIVSSNETILKDGDTYVAKITSCNGAGVCMTATSEKLLVDSTPPRLGGFMNPMSWTNTRNETKIKLIWYGFEDNESGMREYLIGVSKLYSGDELSNGLRTLKHSNRLQQTLSLTLTEKLNSNDVIVLTVIGINNVGLRSDVGKVSVTLVPSNTNNTEGILVFQRHSCISHYCNNDCTCAIVGKKCTNEIKTACTDLRKASAMLNISVYFGLDSIPSAMSSSTTCLSGFWADKSPLKTVLRYEWSVGENGGVPGYGIFDPTTENVWHDNGILRNIVHCLPSHKRLHHGQHYKLYVKAWVSQNEYAIFHSNSLLIDLTPPMIRQGHTVIESDTNNECLRDVDYVEYLKPFKVCWGGVFFEKEGKLVTYEISGGTKPFGDDFLSRTFINSSTFYEVNQTMNPGTKYFFTIVARNNLGLETAAISDGIMLQLDDDIQSTGTVYNTENFRNILYQFSTSTLSASWHGFEDQQLSVKSYEIGVYENESNTLIRRVEKVSMSNHHTFKYLNLKNNHSYYVKVQVKDGMHHVSHNVNSRPVRIDTSPPIAVKCQIFDNLQIQSFLVVQKSSLVIENAVIKGTVSLKKNNVYRFDMDILQKLQFNTLKFRIGNEVMVLSVNQNADLSSSVEHQFVSIYEGNVDFEIIISSKEEILEERVQIIVQQCKSFATSTSPFIIRQINPGLLSVCSLVLDQESGIQRVIVGAGTTRGGYQVRPLSPFSKFNHGLIKTDIPHGSRIYFTAVATNNAGQRSIFTQEVTIDHTPPMISNVNVKIHNDDNFNKSIKKNFSSLSSISELSTTRPLGETHLTVGWSTSEKESKLLHCYCSADPWQASSVRNWQHSLNETYCEISNLTFDHGTKVFVSIKCINAIQLAGEETVGPFTIYHKSPKAERASISFYPDNRYTVFEMPPKVQVQSNLTHVDFTWDGFEDGNEILSYETRLWKGDTIIAPWRSVGFRNSALRKTPTTEKGDTILIEVRAISNGGYKSSVINASIVLDNRPPALTGLQASYRISKGSYSIKWPNVFSPSPYGSTIYVITAGSSVGSADILLPVSTMAEEIDLEWSRDKSQHEIFVDILAFAANGEFSHYDTKFFVE